MCEVHPINMNQRTALKSKQYNATGMLQAKYTITKCHTVYRTTRVTRITRKIAQYTTPPPADEFPTVGIDINIITGGHMS